MISISHHITKELKEDYYQRVRNYLDAPKHNRLDLAIQASNKNKKEKDAEAFKTLKDNLREIILLSSDRLYELDDLFSKFGDIPFFKEKMESFYKSFFNFKDDEGVNNSFWLLKELNIRTCPYCNRSYTFTIIFKTKKSRPEFDHFYPKSQKPWLALSLYNLVPSCPTCNRLKSIMTVSDHPYHKKSDFSFKYDPWKKRVEIDNKKNSNDNENENVKVFGLQSLYEGHSDYAKEIFDKAIAYNHSVYDTLIYEFQGLVKTQEELERLIWGNYVNEEDFDKRPLSKLTSDILKQLEIK